MSMVTAKGNKEWCTERSHRRGLRRAHVRWVLMIRIAAVLFLLGSAAEAWIRLVYIPSYLRPKFDPAGLILRDRTGGKELEILLAIASTRPRQGMRIVMVGDGAVNVPTWKPQHELPYLVDVHAQKTLNTLVDVIDYSLPAMDVGEAAIMVARAFELEPALVVYGVTPCALAGVSAQDPMLLALAGTPRVFARLTSDFRSRDLPLRALARGFWSTNIRLVGLFPQLLDSAFHVEREGRGVPRSPSQLRPSRRPATYLAECRPSEFLENASISRKALRGLRAIAAICEREDGRCLLYFSPLNPRFIATIGP